MDVRAMLCAAWIVAATAAPAAAGQIPAPVLPGVAAEHAELGLPLDFDGPPPPVAPEVIARDASGRATLRAVRVTAPLRLDGRLDEALYQTVPPISDFIQQEPDAGAPATEKTEAWIAFDNDNLYVAFRCWDSRPDRLVATELRRDNGNIWSGNDHVSFMLDTFHDGRNSFHFAINPIGGRQDAQVTNERQWNGNWNTIWDLAVGRFEGGWTVEAAIPFKSLRYGPGRTQVWGFNAFRTSRWKNEIAYITRIPPARGQQGLFQGSLAATLVGLEAPSGSRNIEVKPYVISSVKGVRTPATTLSNDASADLGFDVKYGVTPNLTADLTYNTDFAQVEDDEQQVNLTRFSLFFPEKREFFLENQGTFSFGGVPTTGGGDAPILVYTRRIGLVDGRSVPIVGGGRLTGRVGRYTVGVLNIQTDAASSSQADGTNFTVARVKRDLLGRSSVGALFAGRSVAQRGTTSNETYGVDATLGLFSNLDVHSYWARTQTGGQSGADTSSRVQFDFPGDRYGVLLERLSVGEDFNPEVGFVRRTDMLRHFASFRFSPRPQSIRSVRKFSWLGSVDHIQNSGGRLETREQRGEFAIEFQNGDRLSAEYSDFYELLPGPFRIAPVVVVPGGGYDFGSARVNFNMGPQRKQAANFSIQRGTFYDGDITSISVSRGRLNLTSQFSLEPTYSWNRVELPQGAFTTQLLGSRVTYALTPLMFTSALVQYNSATNAVTSNARLRWEFQPGSELFVVYNDERDTASRGFPTLDNRTFVVKINRTFRF